MRSETSFEIDGDLLVVETTVVGPNGRAMVHLILDTGSALTTIVPEIAEAIGYSAADRVARSVMRTAVGDEHGYVVLMPQLTALGVTLLDVHANVADLGDGIDGLLGMNFLADFNFEIRPAERRILIERIGTSGAD